VVSKTINVCFTYRYLKVRPKKTIFIRVLAGLAKNQSRFIIKIFYPNLGVQQPLKKRGVSEKPNE
jgi:hypothetical protein